MAQSRLLNGLPSTFGSSLRTARGFGPALAYPIMACVVCTERAAQVCLVPCGHVPFCVECETKAAPLRQCPVCRGAVERSLQIYFPGSGGHKQHKHKHTRLVNANRYFMRFSNPLRRGFAKARHCGTARSQGSGGAARSPGGDWRAGSS